MKANDFIATAFVFRGALSAEECAAVRAHAAELPEANVGFYPEPAQPVRRASTRLVDLREGLPWLGARLAGFAHRANERFAFDVEQDIDSAMCVSYRTGSFFHWHTDLADGVESRRKLSLSLQLSDPADYEGGGLQLVCCEVPVAFPEQGSLVVFPAHLAHRVLPVTRGERVALVAWMPGPPFR